MKEKKPGLLVWKGDWLQNWRRLGKMLELNEDSGNGIILQEAAGEWAREGPLQEAAFGFLERCCP